MDRDVICGVYLLYDADEIVYVGKSRVNCYARIKNHEKDQDKTFDSFSIHECEEWIIADLEIHYIRKFKPKYNIIYNPDVFRNRKPVNRRALRLLICSMVRLPRDKWPQITSKVNAIELRKVMKEMNVDFDL